MIVQVCVGSSCHLKGSYDIIEMLQKEIEKHGIEDDVTLAGTFCIGKCGGKGVTVAIDGEVVGVTREEFQSFFKEYILDRLNA